MVFDLPLPPSVNNLFRNVAGTGRVKTKAYKTWLAEAKTLVMAQRIGQQKIPAAYELAVVVSRSKHDLDNFLKAIGDMLTEMAIVVDDSLAQRIVIERGDVKGCRVTVTPWR